MILLALVLSVNVAVSLSENCETVTVGNQQSPVNIDTHTVIVSQAKPLIWSPDYYTPQAYELVNVGNTLEIRKSKSSEACLTLSGGQLQTQYSFQKIQFHWGQEDGMGSEHKINKYAYPVEMQVIHKQETDTSSDQYAVVSSFFQFSNDINLALSLILQAAYPAAANKNIPIPLEPLILSSLVPTNAFPYYTYHGSLTSPPYTESVTWIIKDSPSAISGSQLEIFRKAARLDIDLANNYRCQKDLKRNQKVTLISSN